MFGSSEGVHFKNLEDISSTGKSFSNALGFFSSGVNTLNLRTFLDKESNRYKAKITFKEDNTDVCAHTHQKGENYTPGKLGTPGA